MGAAEILPGSLAQIAATDAAEAESGLTHAWRRSRKRRHGPDLFLSPQILVALVDPISARRRENVEVDRVFHGLRLVRHVRRDAKDLSGVHHNFFAIDPKLERPVEDIRQLLVVRAMLRDDTALL